MYAIRSYYGLNANYISNDKEAGSIQELILKNRYMEADAEACATLAMYSYGKNDDGWKEPYNNIKDNGNGKIISTEYIVSAFNAVV